MIIDDYKLENLRIKINSLSDTDEQVMDIKEILEHLLDFIKQLNSEVKFNRSHNG